MNKSVYAAIGNAAAQENANAKSINWAVSYLENTEYDWMAKQLESEEKRRGKIYLKTLVGCIVATLLLLAPTVLLSDYLENMSHAQYSSDNQRQATVFRNDGIILWTYNSQRFEKPLSEIPYDGEANRITIDVDENGNYLGVGKVPSTFSGYAYSNGRFVGTVLCISKEVSISYTLFKMGKQSKDANNRRVA